MPQIDQIGHFFGKYFKILTVVDPANYRAYIETQVKL